MAPSQLKQLKISLRESGVIGPQQSKKKKRNSAKNGTNPQDRIRRNASLQSIRERFNPFEIKASVRHVKFDVTTSNSKAAQASDYVRPGVTKSLGERRRRETLLRALQTRNKAGGILDRRFGENDPTMTPEERAAERFARESQRKLKKESLFNLEDEDGEGIQLTHMGRSIAFDEDAKEDDFTRDDIRESDNNISEAAETCKRKHFLTGDIDTEVSGEDNDEQPERKKTKAEVMNEVIAKSKFHKQERQKIKEDDDNLRAELDRGLPNLFDLMRSIKRPLKNDPLTDNSAIMMNPDREALLKQNDQAEVEREYDRRLKQMTLDKRSQPTDRTKTKEEIAQEEAGRLEALEAERLRRMRGEEESDADDGTSASQPDHGDIPDDAKAFGLSQVPNEKQIRSELGVEDEDDFIIDGDLVETDSNLSLSFIQSDRSDVSDGNSESGEDDEDENGELGDETMIGFRFPADNVTETISGAANSTQGTEDNLAFTYPCPESHEHFLAIIKDVDTEKLPIVVQRIRALYHPRLHSNNKHKLARFSVILIEHVVYMANELRCPSFTILENLLRHIHSLAKIYPESVVMAFRSHLREIATKRPLKLLPGDLVILTGVATIFPTSDHFHVVVTPTNLSLARYLGQSSIGSLADLATGAYASSLCTQYQTFAKRYMPEFMNYCLNGLCVLCPEETKENLGFFPLRSPSIPLRLSFSSSRQISLRRIRFRDVLETRASPDSCEELKLSLIHIFTSLLDCAADLWATKPAFKEIFNPALSVLQHLSKSCSNNIPSALRDQIHSTIGKIRSLLTRAQTSRRPLLLHNHRPLAIKTYIPKFEEDFNPDKHYDPNRERAELNRLKAEYRRERKGAMRELRKDGSFIARETLREKKERDAAYEKKFKRLMAEIQGEEGREAKAYEREKRLRQGKQ